MLQFQANMSIKKTKGKYAENLKAIHEGATLSGAHPLIQPLPNFSMKTDGLALNMGSEEWFRLQCEKPWKPPSSVPNMPPSEPHVTIWPNIRRRAHAAEWAYLLARIRLHIALNHLDPEWEHDLCWHSACWLSVEQMLSTSGVGKRPQMPQLPEGYPKGDEKSLALYFQEEGIPPDILSLSLGCSGKVFWTFTEPFVLSEALRKQHGSALAKGIRAAATAAVDVAGGARKALAAEKSADTIMKRARQWMISEYPLLAALAASFRLIEDAELCKNMDVDIAAISDASQEIYVNPCVTFTEEEAKFVMAHELLHTGLRHSQRRQGRDPWLWNVACDYVINDWLMEMQLGHPPVNIGFLHDLSLRGLSAEDIYDRIVRDLRWMRKLRKARSMNGARSDVLEGDHRPSWWRGGGVELDQFYRRALAEGLDLHKERGRGFLPAGLIEEIRSQMQQPIPWDVQLAHWLDQFFPPLEKKRTYARAHRRQSATPDIPRPAWIQPDEQRSARVFGVVLDTSGSMTRADLGKAAGAIASYALSRDVSFIRLIQCDAAPHDTGYLKPEELLETIRIKGRGGTILMPGITLLENARDFPPDGPILIITDGYCDPLRVRRSHAYLVAGSGRLPFPPQGPVFHFS